jgi:hypothetical protein
MLKSLNTELGFRFDKGALHGEVIGTTISRICKVLILCLAVALEQVIYLMLVHSKKELSYWQLMM